MVLDFGKGSLFRPSGLEQDTGLLRDRWGQDGSSIFNIVFVSSIDATVYTVTAGKRLFISSIVISEDGAGGDGALFDGGAGGTQKFDFSNPGAKGTIGFNLSTPLYFDTDVYYNEGAACSGSITLTGWEEDAP